MLFWLLKSDEIRCFKPAEYKKHGIRTSAWAETWRWVWGTE